MSRRFVDEGILSKELQIRVESALKEVLALREKRTFAEKVRGWVGRRLGL